MNVVEALEAPALVLPMAYQSGNARSTVHCDAMTTCARHCWLMCLLGCALSLCTLCSQAADFVVAATATMTLTFGGRRMGEVGPAPHCKAPVTATATVTGTAGVAAPTGNVTLAISSHSSVLDPFTHTLYLPPVRRGPMPAEHACAAGEAPG